MELFEDENGSSAFSNVRNTAKKSGTTKKALSWLCHESDEVNSSDVYKARKLMIPNHSPQILAKSKEEFATMDTSTIKKRETYRQCQNVLGENGFASPEFLKLAEQFWRQGIIFLNKHLEEFFGPGKFANVLWPGIRHYRYLSTSRECWPMYPYLLVSRVTKMNAKLGVYQPSTMTPEYDIPYNAWLHHLSADPSAVCCGRSGQCWFAPHFLFRNWFCKIKATVYALLDCRWPFNGRSPLWRTKKPCGMIYRSIRLSPTEKLIFFFSYLCYVEIV